jgi:hypothetical protein
MNIPPQLTETLKQLCAALLAGTGAEVEVQITIRVKAGKTEKGETP